MELGGYNTANANSDEYIEQLNFCIFSAVVSLSKSFKRVGVIVQMDSQLILVKIRLGWWMRRKFKWIGIGGFMNWMREDLRVNAIDAAGPFIPSGWRLVVYYER